ncbi:MAG: 30S ribosomal protein S4 [Patescibacteria group bacterium]
MGRDIGPKFKKERRAGVKLMLRGKSSDSPTSPFTKRSYPPGVHGPKGHPRKTQYGSQLMEKQKAKWIYGLREKQFKKYYNKALKAEGDTGAILVQMLEQRLDNVVFRLGFAATRNQARQFVNHWHIRVNGGKVDIPSYQVKVGDVIEIRDKSKKMQVFEENTAGINIEHIPNWLSVDPRAMNGKVVSLPKVDEDQTVFDVKAIVEFYSR